MISISSISMEAAGMSISPGSLLGEQPQQNFSQVSSIQDSDKKALIGSWLMALMPTISEYPKQVLVTQVRAGLIRVTWPDSNGINGYPYSMEGTDLLAVPKKDPDSKLSKLKAALERWGVLCDSDGFSLSHGDFSVDISGGRFILSKNGKIILNQDGTKDPSGQIARLIKSGPRRKTTEYSGSVKTPVMPGDAYVKATNVMEGY